MMVAAVVRLRQRALPVDRAAELAAPDHERAVEQAALLQIGQKRAGRLIGVLALRADVVGQVAMLVPAAVQDLHDAHAALDQPPRQQRACGERAGLLHLRAVHLQRSLRSLRQVGQLRHAASACGTPFRTARCASAFPDRRTCRRSSLVQLAERIEHGAAAGCADAGGVLHVQHRIADAAQGDAAVLARQEAAASTCA